MKLIRIHPLGRYRHRVAGQCVNIHKGVRAVPGTDHYFYLLRGKRQFIVAVDMHRDWQRLPI